MHRIDNVLFSHGGLTVDFLRWLNDKLLEADVMERIYDNRYATATGYYDQ